MAVPTTLRAPNDTGSHARPLYPPVSAAQSYMPQPTGRYETPARYETDSRYETPSRYDSDRRYDTDPRYDTGSWHTPSAEQRQQPAYPASWGSAPSTSSSRPEFTSGPRARFAR